MHTYTIKRAKTEIVTPPDAGRDEEKLDCFHTADANVKWHSYTGKVLKNQTCN